MFYPNLLKGKNINYLTCDFNAFSLPIDLQTDENLMSLKRVKKSYNFRTSSGALENGHGFSYLKMPAEPEVDSPEHLMCIPYGNFTKCWHYKYYSRINNRKQHVLFLLDEEGVLYWAYIFSQGGVFGYANLTFQSIPKAVNYRLENNDVMIFSSPEDDLTIFDRATGATATADAPKICDLCVHAERLFAVSETDKFTLRFSDDLNITNWTESITEGGYITFSDDLGAIGKLISLGDYLYLIREFGITRVSAFGSQADFTTSNIYSTSSKIYPASCVNCQGSLVFLNKDGIYSFDGASCEKLSFGIEELGKGIYNKNTTAAFYRGKYYLALRLDFNDGQKLGCENGDYINNALIEIDLETREWNITRGVDIVCLTPIEEENVSKLVAIFGSVYKDLLGQLDDSGKFFSDNTVKEWQSANTNLGYPGKEKFISELYIQTRGDIELTIKTDKKTRTYHLHGSEKTQLLKPKLVGEKMQVTIRSESDDCYVSWPRAVIGIVS